MARILYTAKQIFDRVRNAPFCQRIDPTQFLSLLNESHADLCQIFDLDRQSFTINLRTTDSSYALNESIVWVESAKYQYGSEANEYTEMTARHIDEIRARDPYTLVPYFPGQPDDYYIDSGKLNLTCFPEIETNLTTGLPCIKLECTVNIGFSTIDSEISKQLMSGLVYVYAVAERFLDSQFPDCTTKEGAALYNILVSERQNMRSLKIEQMLQMQHLMNKRAARYRQHFSVESSYRTRR